MPATTPQSPVRLQTPLRELADLRNTIRMSRWEGGFDMDLLQEAFGVLAVSPGYFDAQNFDAFTVAGTIRLAAKWTRCVTHASNKEALLYPFNQALYILPTTNFAAADVRKITQPTGVPSDSALANIYPGAVAPRNAVVWRDQWIVASADTVLRVMSTAEAWTTIAAPGGVTAPVSGQIGVSQQDKLSCWWEGSAGAGLYEWNGSTWTQIFPPSGVTLPVSPTCDMILNGPGSFLFATRDSTGITRLYEYLIQTTGTAFAVWLLQQGYRFWPQSGAAYAGVSWYGGRMGQMQQVGPIYAKSAGQDPGDPVFLMDTNYATDSQKGLDWAVRAMFSAGDVLHIGSASRFDHKAANYRLESDADGEIIHPGSVLGVDGPMYSIGMIPSGVAGSAAGERLFCSASDGIYYKDANDGADPTMDASPGIFQFPDIDLGSPDHAHIWAAAALDVLQRSAGGSISVQYRVDPKKLSDPWVTLAPKNGSIVEGDNPFRFPDDNKAQRKRGTAARVLQVRLLVTAATSGTKRDVIDAIAFRWARTKPLGVAV